MEILIKLNVPDGTDPLAIGQFFQWGARLEAGKALISEDTARTGADQGGGDEGMDVAEDTTGATPRRRGGRRRAATAEEQAASIAGATAEQPPVAQQPAPVAAAPVVNTALPPGVPPGGFAPPPGVTAPAAVATAAPPAAAAVAMPPVQAAAPPMANGHMSLEDFRRQASEIQTAAAAKQLTAAYPFNIYRGNTWPDGTAKPFSAITLEGVPEEFRARVIDEALAILMRS